MMNQNNPSDRDQKHEHNPENQPDQPPHQLWDSAAATFDHEPDHGLRDAGVRAAWSALLSAALADAPLKILDLGCGTGSLSLVLADLGHDVTGIDFSPEMIARAEEKAQTAGRTIEFHVMDAAAPQFLPQQFDALLCRHVLWTLPASDQVLRRWERLLKPGGRLILIEGFWHTGAGLRAQQITDVLPDSFASVSVQSLSDRRDLWGGQTDDERYIITAELGA